MLEPHPSSNALVGLYVGARIAAGSKALGLLALALVLLVAGGHLACPTPDPSEALRSSPAHGHPTDRYIPSGDGTSGSACTPNHEAQPAPAGRSALGQAPTLLRTGAPVPRDCGPSGSQLRVSPASPPPRPPATVRSGRLLLNDQVIALI